MADLLQLVKRHQLTPYAYADDTQIYGSCRPADTAVLSERLSVCVVMVSAWMAAGFNLTMPRPRCYGVPHHAGSIKSYTILAN